jgi:hypothetical protein
VFGGGRPLLRGAETDEVVGGEDQVKRATPVGEMTSRIGDVITRGAEEDVEIETPDLRRPRGREIPLYQPRILGKLGESESA